ncbi:hypothetical protein G6K88_13850 [Agrobacterium rhizogenes]|uniref:LuxR C-terminal-related transcriptional regulator n=1 Tax=Rhizobium rhizogenes TaxID=359 RepID=UPI00115CC7B6|nr:LuxR C-terminal-related transcriptional regulator [Rhizobium rhizogenes]NTI03103.1 hypothetical protein [Rhizobium rhizogenes]NTI09907.1 hypothetical protein [Rhizobium rhizogenes]TRB20252.1 hypothetical protein EXN70_26335 [Rhizobium rhizogenes]
MSAEVWTKKDFDELLRMWIDGKTTVQIAEELGRTPRAVSTKGSRLGLFSLTQQELAEPGVAVRTCLNPVNPHPFVSAGKWNRTCITCKQTQIFQAA